ncbi:hypothetical protein [Rhizobium ruizarguesonis]|uniref:hypothetical protein n=1 Tax=Rhizobium ruizarguesonis TaxID=2081791 RepID=UPI00102FA4BF|nr:hypothetical protein [Rhizobium ruizarguesonis]TBA11985.1 hypothetical protein ELH65_26590 [Rhizobium ruizarguesonis]
MEGTTRIFVLPADEHRTARVGQVRAFLGRVNEDPLWLSDHDEADVRMLVVAHRMASAAVHQFSPPLGDRCAGWRGDRIMSLLRQKGPLSDPKEISSRP